MSKKCVSHTAVDGVLKDVSPNYVNVNGESHKMWYDPRTKFPSIRVQERLPEVVLQLQLLERKKYLLEKQFQGKGCIGLHLDMWTNTDSVEGEQYVCVIMTTVVEPMDTTTPGAQLRLRSDIVDFNVFP